MPLTSKAYDVFFKPPKYCPVTKRLFGVNLHCNSSCRFHGRYPNCGTEEIKIVQEESKYFNGRANDLYGWIMHPELDGRRVN